MDIHSKSQFRKVMSESESARRCTFISTHQVRDLESIIDHMTVLHSGQIIFNQPVSDIAERLTFKKTAVVPPESLYSEETDRKSTRLNSSHVASSYAVFCLKKKKRTQI